MQLPTLLSGRPHPAGRVLRISRHELDAMTRMGRPLRLLLIGLAMSGCLSVGALVIWTIIEGGITPPPAATCHVPTAAERSPTPFFGDLFRVYTPRWICMYGETPVIWLHVISDAAIALAYYSIPFALVYFVRQRRDVQYGWVFWLFALFILACGTTHLFGVIDVWRPWYRVDGIIKLITAAASLGTAVALWPLIPKALTLPSASELEQRVRERTAELAEANSALHMENEARRKAEAERESLLSSERRARSEAERASRLKDEFLATLSHELRTPLNAILGWAQLLMRNSASEAEIRRGLEVIERNARAQARLVEDLLDMSRIVSGRIHLDMQRVDLPEVIHATLHSVEPAAQSKRIQISLEIEPGTGPIHGDPARVQQIVWNLLSNAVKFTPAGGQVRIAARQAEEQVEIEVTDTGEGISPDFMPHIFERFRQADSGLTRKHGGLGLGLAIVKQLVEAHGGSIRVESPGKGQGSSFVVRLPTMAASDTSIRPEPAMPEAAESSDLHGLDVLVVDDEADARELARQILENAGVRARLASNTAEAFESLLERPPDVLVSDIGMPGEDGYALLRRIRRLDPDRGGRTPAIAMTAFAGPGDRHRAMTAGYQFHIAKPIEREELLAAVGRLASRRA